MRRDSSARRSSTMVAVSVAAVVIPMVVGMLLLPGAEGAAIECPAFTGTIKSCNHEVRVGDTFQIDCTGSTSTVIPAKLLNSNVSNIEVCRSDTLRADADTTCTGSVLSGSDGVGTVTTIPNGWKAEYTGVKGDKDVIINGACKVDATKGYYFNFTLKANTTTKAPDGSGATSAFGLAAASSVALLGLVMAAA